MRFIPLLLKSLFSVLPTPLAGGPTNAPISDLANAEAPENGLAPAYSAFFRYTCFSAD